MTSAHIQTTVITLLAAATLSTGRAATVLLDTFSLDSGLQNASAYDPVTDTVWSKAGFGSFRNYSRTGALPGTLADATPSDDSDFTITRGAVNIGGTTVPGGSELGEEIDWPAGGIVRKSGRMPGLGKSPCFSARGFAF